MTKLNIQSILLKITKFLLQFLEFCCNLLSVSVSEWGGRVGLPTLGTLHHPGPALGTHQVLLNTTEDLSPRSLQADWTLQVGLLLSDGRLLLLHWLGQEADKSLFLWTDN